MADLAVEIADLNSNARELLSKYDGAFSKLDEETQNKILTLQTTADDLKAQIESLGLKFDDNGALVDKDGNPLRIKVADAVNDDDAVNRGQLRLANTKFFEYIGDDITMGTENTYKIDELSVSYTPKYNTSFIEIYFEGQDYGGWVIKSWANYHLYINGVEVALQRVGHYKTDDADEYKLQIFSQINLTYFYQNQNGDTINIDIYFDEAYGTVHTLYGDNFKNPKIIIKEYINEEYINAK